MSEPVMIITGTRKGIGRYLAERYVAQGWRVIGCSRKQPDWMLAGYRHICTDITDEKGVLSLFASVSTKEGRLDAVINNAGIASMNHTLLTPLATLQTLFSTNVTGTFLFCREGAKLMARSGGGRIVNFSSIAAPLNLEGEAVYAASKSAVESLTRTLSRELASLKITVNAVGPTPVPTDLIRSIPQGKMDALLARQAIRRFGEMRDVANVVDFFLNANSDFVTGQVLYLGGVS